MPPADPEDLARRLAEFIEQESGSPDGSVTVTGLRRLAGGASRELWSLDAELDARAEGGPRTLELVLRRDPPGRTGDFSDRRLEFELLRCARGAGVPVPRVHWACSDPGVLETPFFLMERLEGETIPRRLLRDEAYARAREGMVGELGAILARIHAVDFDRRRLRGLERPKPGRSPAEDQLATSLAAVRELAPEPHPILELAARWLERRLPRDQRQTLVHGDYRVGNVMFDTKGVVAILDWELAHVGDPVEDLGWLCTKAWRFGSELPAGGIGTREALLEAYDEGGGHSVSLDHLLFWEALGSFKVALVFIRQAHVHLSGAMPSLELASLGRRTAEAEEALVEIMEAAP
jgi:aminoglycoside phosphotransferase (APT) family kinase protein